MVCTCVLPLWVKKNTTSFTIINLPTASTVSPRGDQATVVGVETTEVSHQTNEISNEPVPAAEVHGCLIEDASVFWLSFFLLSLSGQVAFRNPSRLFLKQLEVRRVEVWIPLFPT